MKTLVLAIIIAFSVLACGHIEGVTKPSFEYHVVTVYGMDTELTDYSNRCGGGEIVWAQLIFQRKVEGTPPQPPFWVTIFKCPKR